MPVSSSLVKGSLESIEGETLRLEFLFNPTKYSVSKQNTWNPRENVGADVAPLEFGGGQPKSLTMELFFDTYEAGTDVREYTGILERMMQISEDLRSGESDRGRPPYCRLCWGRMFSFVCVLQNLSIDYTLFLPDGTPVRATADLTLTQTVDENEQPAQNPTSGGQPGNRVWTVRPGETIDWISFKTLGSASRWRTIADANDLLDPKALSPGQQLVIPPRS
jgi:hypothetical protein